MNRNVEAPKLEICRMALEIENAGREDHGPMSDSSRDRALTLGIEGGGTQTTWCLVDAGGTVRAEGVLGSGNVAMMTDEELLSLYRAIARALPDQPAAIGAGLAGVVNPEAAARARALLGEVFPLVRTIVVDHDARSGFLAAHPSGAGVLVIAGTGSFVLGCCGGRWARAHGRGHVAGDAGSAYDLAERGLRAVFTYYDETGMVSALGKALLAATSLDSLEDLSAWVSRTTVSKKTIAGLARTVVEAGEAGCPLALACVVESAEALVRSVASVTRRLEMKKPSVALSGGLLTNSKLYREAFSRQLAARLVTAEIRVSTTPGALGAARLVGEPVLSQASASPPVIAKRSSNTEQRNPRTRNLEQRSVPELVGLFLDESELVVPALRTVAPQLVKATELIVASLQKGGRMFYVGAGTSGRLGVLDASELPPTFGVPPAMAQGLIAGGVTALALGVENVEDDGFAGANAIRQHGVGDCDVVVGIAASGRTPFVVAALEEARHCGAKTVFLTCNPHRPALPVGPDVAVDIPTAPEFLTGSTRLAAGTATKIALNLLSTLAMIRLGKVRDNLMIDVRASNAKLRDRATRIVMELTGWDESRARTALTQHDWNIRAVLAGTPGPAPGPIG